MKNIKEPSFIDAFIPVLVLIIALAFSVVYFADNSSYGPNQIALLLAGAVAAIIGLKNGHKWQTIEKGIIKGVSIAITPILILLLIGSLIGTWLLAGTVPSLINYGLAIISPSWFYVATCIVCAIVAISIGSSWTAAATVGVAFMGIATGMDMSPSITAGAIISGAYFGDKMSPFSDTTNLSSAVSGADLFDHIKYMSYTSFPSIIITLIIFMFLGLGHQADVNLDKVAEISTGINSVFSVSIIHLVPLVVLITLAIKKMPAIPAIFLGIVIGALWAMIFQQDAINLLFDDIKGGNIAILWTVLSSGIEVTTGNETTDSLLSGGGMGKMLNTVWIILTAMTFGAIMEKLGLLKKLVDSILRFAKSTGSLIANTILMAFGVNLIASDQYISIVMPGRMFKKEYENRGLASVNLSRSLEDGGTITSPLIPWNTCGAYMHSVLLINPLEYLMFCFFNILSPIFAIIIGYLGFQIKKLKS